VFEKRMPSRRVPVVAGVAAGQAAWVVGSLLAFVAVRAAEHESILSAALDDAAPSPEFYQAVGWVFYNAHTVGITVEPSRQGSSASPFTAVLVGGDGVTPLLYAVPVVVLAAAGGVVAFATGSRGSRHGLVAGLAVVPGYLVLAVAGVLVTSTAWSMGPGGTASPAAVAAVVRAGFLYPVVCAGGAGLLVGAVLDATGVSPPRSRPESTGGGDRS
jgi:hypothetical protein